MKLKKLLGLVLASAMLLALVVPASASVAAGGTITITYSDSDHTTPVGRTFNAYKILDVSLAADNTPAYTVPSDLYAFYGTEFHTDANHYNGMTPAAVDADVVATIGSYNLTDEIEDFAQDALDWLTNHSVAATETISGTTIDYYQDVSVPLGYYIIGEVSGSGSQVSAVMLDTTTAGVTIALKANTPGIEKKIVTSSGLTDYTEGDIGDTVHYQISSKVPDTTGFNSYTYNVSDAISSGLTYQGDLLVFVDMNDSGTFDTGDYNLSNIGDVSFYSVTAPTGYTFLITFENFTQFKAQNNATIGTSTVVAKSLIGKTILIQYSAKINENAIIGDAGNPNGAKLEYSNDPQGSTTTTTVEDKTYTYVTGIDLTKIVAGTSSNPVTLAGATFKLEGVDPTVTNIVVTFVENDALVEGTDTIYYKQADGSYSTTSTGAGATKYERNVQTTTSSYSATATTGADGVLTFNGLSQGTYLLTETDAPDGYMLAAPATIVITWNDPATNPTPIWSYTMDGVEVTTKDGNGEMKINVDNTKGHELPSTGGIGTTIFYIGGLVLIVAAGLLLILRRKGKATTK